jgi:Na+/H+-dicarboxylate symporter
VLPLGTTINMDGTALYQVMCVTFLAQMFGVDLSLTDQITVAFMAILVAIGSPGLPGASLVLMVFILEAVKVPVEGMAIILAVDRILDMCRTVVNVAGDATAAVIVAKSEGQLQKEAA